MADKTRNLDLPNGEATLLCECGYESDPFYFNDAIYRCTNCRTVEQPLRVPFLLQPPDCETCGVPFSKSNAIAASTMRAKYLNSEEFEEHVADLIECPSCNQKKLAINSLGIDVSCMETDTVIPNIGDRIHARVINSGGTFLYSSPRLSFEMCRSISVENVDPAEFGNGYHEFLVVDVQHDSTTLILDYLRRLRPEEWNWFT